MAAFRPLIECLMKNIGYFLRLSFVIVAGLMLPGVAQAWCDNDCAGGQCCYCATEPQCLGANESCDHACGLVAPKLECPPGSVANREGNECRPADSKDCGGGLYCKTGYQCGSDGGCVKAELVPCGKGKYCAAGMSCGSGERCLRNGDVDCGNGTACSAGKQCTAGGCLPAGTTACGTGFCNGSDRCVSGRCIPAKIVP